MGSCVFDDVPGWARSCRIGLNVSPGCVVHPKSKQAEAYSTEKLV